MRSNFFSSMGKFPPTRLKDVIKIFTCEKELFEKMVGWIDTQDEFPRIDRATRSHLVETTQTEDPDLISSVLKGILWLLSSYAQSGDEFEDFYDDFQLLHIDELKNVSDVELRIEALSHLTEKYVHYVAKVIAQSKGSPTLEHTDFSVALKPIILKSFDQDDDGIENYEPEIAGFAPVVLMQFENSETEAISFSLNPCDLDKLINKMLALKIELNRAVR